MQSRDFLLQKEITYLNFIGDSLFERAEQWNSWAPEPSKIRCRFLSVIPPPEIRVKWQSVKEKSSKNT